MITRMYRAYCRSCTRAGCSPVVIGIGLIVMAVACAAVARYISAHEHEITVAARDAAAAILCAVATALAAWAARIVTSARGTVHEHGPAADAPAGIRVVPVADETALLQPAALLPRRVLPGAPGRGKSDLVTPLVNGQVLPPDVLRRIAGLPDDGAACMAAEADQLDRGEIVPVVTAGGVLMDLARREP